MPDGTRNSPLYSSDFHAWALRQAALIRAGKLAEADLEHIAEEIESMGRSEKRELLSRLEVLLLHLLKWQVQPNRRGRSWRLTIEEQRRRLETHLDENPSLRHLLIEAVISAYPTVLIAAQRETGLAASAFPATCPYSLEQIANPAYLPE